MLKSSVEVIEILVGELKAKQEHLEDTTKWPFYATINALIHEAYTLDKCRQAHIAIDCCSIAILLIAPSIPNTASVVPR